MNALPFSVVIQQFVSLRSQANDEWDAMKALKTGDALVLSVDQLMSVAESTDQAPLHAALRKYVKSLPDDQLYSLLALVYAGREGVDDPVSFWHTQLRTTVHSRNAAVEVLLEKEHAGEHAEKAVGLLRPGLQLEGIPALVWPKP